MGDYLSKWSEDRVVKRIAELTKFQRGIFEKEMDNGKPERQALFLATSWPDNIEIETREEK